MATYEELHEIIKAQQKTIEKLTAELEAAKEEIAELKEKLNNLKKSVRVILFIPTSYSPLYLQLSVVSSLIPVLGHSSYSLSGSIPSISEKEL